MSVREAQDRIDSREFAEWIARDRHEPVGAARIDALAGIIASTIANTVPRGENAEPYGAGDFIPDWWKEPDATPAIDQTTLKSKLLLVFAKLAAQPPSPLPK